MAAQAGNSTTGRIFATRLQRLGTETAYKISEEAAARKNQGKTTYNYHIGDLNFNTPENVKTALLNAVKQNKTGYCPASGIPQLRSALAKHIGSARGVEYGPANVSIQSGGKPVIMKFLMCVMNPGDGVLYPTPGYPIYESQINYLGGTPLPYRLRETSEGFSFDVEHLRQQAKNAKILLYNNYHNPTGIASSDEEMQEIAKIAIEHDLWVLSDEAYFDLVYEGKSKSIVALPGMYERTLILHTFSKSWSMTGWRLGAAIGPAALVAKVNKLNTNDEACTTHFVQYAGIECLSQESKKFINNLVAELKKRRDVLVDGVNSIPGFKAYPPQAAFYLFCNVTKAMEMCGCASVEDFRQLLAEETGIMVCTRDHFGTPLPDEKEFYIRFAYSSVDIPLINKGVEVLRAWMNSKKPA